MKNIKSKTKLLWAISQAGLENIGIEKIAQRIADYEIDSITINYSYPYFDILKSLRSAIDHAVAKKNSVDPVAFGSMIPFVLSFCGRKAFITLPVKEAVEFKTNEHIKIYVRVDPQACSQLKFVTSHQFTEIIVSSQDQMANLKQGSLLSISYDSVILKINEVLKSNENKLLIDCLIEEGGSVTTGMEVHCSDIPRNLFPLLPQDELSLKHKFSNLADYILLNGIDVSIIIIRIKVA
ncbi:MAG: hypothetical protein K2X39_03730 [Silvanigrellaceae bacterium]|nr:hypothetical protein [Silvanigrellaceae bacterium]